MLHPTPSYSAAKPLFFGTPQCLQAPPAHLCRLTAGQLTSVATFHSDRLIEQQSASQQASRPHAVASLEQVSTAVSSNVQPLRKSLHSGHRSPKSRANGRKPRLRVAVDVDEGEELFWPPFLKTCHCHPLMQAAHAALTTSISGVSY
jgi:hypothetical protein